MLNNNVKRNSPFATPTHDPHPETADKDQQHQNDNLSTGMQNISVNATNNVQGVNVVKKQFPLSDPNAIDMENVFSEDDEMTIKNITAAHDDENGNNGNDDQDGKDDSYDQLHQHKQRTMAIKTPYQAVAEDDSQRSTHATEGEEDEAKQKEGEGEDDDDASKYPKCAQCGRAVRHPQPPQTINGPLHPGCVMEYRFVHQPRCKYCDVRFRDEEAATFVKDPETGYLYHPECAEKHKDGVAFVRPSLEGYVRKQGIARKKLAVRSWKTRYFILNPTQNGIKYYVSDPSGRTSAESFAKNESNDNNNNSDSDNDNDEDNNNPGVSEEERRANEKKYNKGSVPLDARSRLITQPFMSLYSPISSMLPSTKELLIIFRDPPESDVERQLLFECQDAKDKHRWMRALEAYIHVVDDPADYKYKPESKRQTSEGNDA